MSAYWTGAVVVAWASGWVPAPIAIGLLVVLGGIAGYLYTGTH